LIISTLNFAFTAAQAAIEE